jgi:hypothetical protein
VSNVLTNNEQRVNVRIPSALVGQLRIIATRDANGISATVRRLLAQAVAIEQRRAEAGVQR